jgi:trehalose-phosphatase
VSGLLLALDFDGTIAAISPSPDEVRIDREAHAFLRELSAKQLADVAIVSGRDVADLLHRTELDVYLAGSHGLEIRAPDGTMLREEPPLKLELEPALQSEALALGMRLERKKHGIALHWREAGESDATVAAADAFRRWAATHDLHVIDGRAVIEARLHGADKEQAVRFLAAHTGARRVLYAGDDLTDFGALAFAASHGRAFFVASDEREAPESVTTTRSTTELLEMLRAEF